MSLPAPATAPLSNAGFLILPPMLQPPLPENDDITPPPAPAITLPISTPPLVAPTLPVIVGDTPPPLPSTLPTPTLSPLPPPQPPLQTPLQTPPLPPPPPINKNISPTNKKTIDSPPPTTSTKSDPIITTSPPASSSKPKTRPITTTSPSKPGPSRHKALPTTSIPPSPLPSSSEILPSSPPLSLQVPQSPSDNEEWIPFSTESPTPLPILPGTPGTFSSPASPLHDSTITSSSSPPSSPPSSSSLSSLSSASDHHQYLQAIAVDPEKGTDNGASSFVVGLAIGGILLLLLATVLGILLVFFKRKEKKKVGDNESGRKCCEFEDKSSLPHYTKHGSNNYLGHHTMINNVSTPKRPNIATNGTPPVNVGPTLGTTPSFPSGTFTYEELSRATNGFSKHNLLGQGGFGYVHKGVLENGKEVAVKQLKMGGPQVEKEFRAEIETISQVHHKHLVSLVGYCIAGVERLLVYEFVPNNTLEFHLHGNRQPVMDWPTRLKIAIGSAKGFAYLHEDCSPSIIHRDIKAANILLDFHFEPKVSDFGLAKILSSTNPFTTHITTRIVGTFGYLAPEYASSGKVTDKSDVYSYGVMLLELITGRPPIINFESSTNGSLVNWARPLLAQAIGDGNFGRLADPKLRNNYKVDEMASMVACAAACVRLSACHRPRMSQVVRALEGNLPSSKLDDGNRPGQSPSHFPYESLDIDAHIYMEILNRMV